MAGWLSGYDRQDFGTDGGSWTRQPALIVLHSTETGDHGWPGYSDGSSAPHFTHDPLTGATRQHVPLDRAARALKNPSGGVETNRAGAIQIEIIGTCDPDRKGDKGWTFLPGFTGWGALSSVLADISAATGIPLVTSVSWRGYPASYGTNASQRVSGSTWGKYVGVLGHQHVPENDHGDPGDINIGAILTTDNATGEWDDMASKQEVTDAVLRADVIPVPDRVGDDNWTLITHVNYLGEWVLACRDMLQDITGRLAELQGQPPPPPLPPIAPDPDGAPAG